MSLEMEEGLVKGGKHSQTPLGAASSVFGDGVVLEVGGHGIFHYPFRCWEGVELLLSLTDVEQRCQMKGW